MLKRSGNPDLSGRVIIPVAGSGERLKPLTDTTPKTLLEVAGVPVLGYILDWIVEAQRKSRFIGDEMNISEVVLVVRPGIYAAQIKDYVRSHRTSLGDFNLRYVEQSEPKGSGHAIWLALQDIKKLRAPVLIINGDMIPSDTADFEAEVSLKPEYSMIGVQQVSNPEIHGVVEVDSRNYVSRFIKKPKHPTTNLAMAGFFYIRRADYLFDALDQNIRYNRRLGGEFSFMGGLILMHQFGESFYTCPVEAFDCGSFEGLKNARRYFG